MEFGFGSGILTGIRNDIGGTQTPIRFGALQNVDIEFDGDIKMLFATQQFPIDSARGKTKIVGKAKTAEVKGELYNGLFFGQTLTTGGTNYAYNESTTLGTGAASYTVANHASTPLTDQGVFDVITGNQYTAVSSAPGSLQYTFNAATGVYSFSTFSAGLGVLVNYLYTVNTGVNIAGGNPFMGTTPRFQATLFQQYEGYQIVLQLYNCVSNRLTFPTHIDDYVITDLDFSAFANASGNVFNWSFGT